MEQIAEGFMGEKAIITPYHVRNYQQENPITRQLFVTHIGYYPNAKHHFRQREEGSNEHLLIYCEQGKGWIEYKGEKHELSRNKAFILPAREKHAYGANNAFPWSIYWLHFCGEDVSFFSSIIGRVIDVKDSDNSRYADRFRLFEEMFQNLEMGYSPENLEYVGFCLRYFLASLKYLNQYREVNTVKEADFVQKGILYMKEHLEHRTTLEDISHQVGYSTSYFAKVFSERTSYSPMDYYCQLRIQRACNYLQFTDMKIKEIAFRLQFYDPFHFSRAFVKEMGITPKEYRKRYRTVSG